MAFVRSSLSRPAGWLLAREREREEAQLWLKRSAESGRRVAFGLPAPIDELETDDDDDADDADEQQAAKGVGSR